jgi:hypothetical protein
MSTLTPGNPRLNDDAVDAVAESIRRFGFRQPIEWFALWADLQDRLARITGVPLDCAPLLREVQPRFGPRRMGTVKARDLAEAIDALDPSLPAEFIGLLALAGLPPDLGVLDARRRIGCAYTGRPGRAAGVSGIDRVA